MSVSASAENLSSDNQSSGDGGNMCLELALEGERLCKAGDCRAGVAFFQAAIQAGTDDLRTLSAIYSQLGNAYFYLGDYVKAMQYHKHDLTLARTMGDKLGEAKSSGNLGNTLKVMGKFDEAMICCKRHLEISRELKDKLSEGRALYNLGNVYHAKGKHIGRVGQQDPGEFPEDVRSCLEQAVKYYEENLELMRELNERAAQGRACGNLGNTYYLLGNFKQAIHYHEERLKIAREFGDKAAERRANSNLGNSHIFLGEFEAAADHYKRTLVLAQELGDRAVEAQSCYSLGNTYTLLRDYPVAVEYHLRHLIIAQQLMDRVGEGRACWSLGNAHSAMGNHEKALYFASKHLEISKELGDPMGQATAQMNVADLRKVLGLPTSDLSPDSLEVVSSLGDQTSPALHRYRLTPDSKQRADTLPPDLEAVAGAQNLTHANSAAAADAKGEHLDDEESFFDLLSRFQSKRMDDQRCSLTIAENKENTNSLPNSNHNNNAAASIKPIMPLNNNNAANSKTPSNALQDDLLDLIAGMQSKRMDEQRVALPHLPGLHPPAQSQVLQRLSVAGLGGDGSTTPDDTFLEMLMRCQGSRLEDQRSSLPGDMDPDTDQRPSTRGPTVPDEDFFSLIMRLQSGRMEDQRATVPAQSHENRLSGASKTASRKDKKK
ncbi:G-protein-signaling modulator 2 [Cryptotermes secundus]|uniref:G-protein-signaling modulator 2 n=1 Tax=Cryptotermes secundus TaxID=105785 RepID=A0A2J7RIZ1_9NEOP|nr:G-protein-signaling modulator 2 isoform X2 [Cryptotermes secundus]PNF40797.1 G-protein-signaling modulator 2 [Cryptotermes secundus]